MQKINWNLLSIISKHQISVYLNFTHILHYIKYEIYFILRLTCYYKREYREPKQIPIWDGYYRFIYRKMIMMCTHMSQSLK